MTMPLHEPARKLAGHAPGVRPSGVLQRVCACGGMPGLTGECAPCRRKRLLRENAPGAPHSPLQPKLRVSAPGDRYEREADQIADRVVRGSMGTTTPPTTPRLQRATGSTTGGAMPAPPIVHDVLASPGRPLEGATRAFMEPRLGYNLSGVRVHTDARAAASARAVGARAYAVGRDVVFGAGAYRPSTPSGQRLLAHELVHTLQQDAVGRLVQRQPVPSPDAEVGPATPTQAAARAEATCDMKALCQIHFANPEVVSKARVTKAALRCRPGVLHLGSPCFNPSIISPELFALPPVSVPGPTGATGTPPAAASPSSLPDLGKYLKFEFKAGDATFLVDLPSSVKFNLPLEFAGSYKITFELVAKSSGAFSFSITLDGVPHVQIKSTTTADASKKSLTSELMVSSSLKTCHAPSPAATKASLQQAGDKLKKAIQNVNKSDAQLDAEKAAAKAPAGTTASVTPSPPEEFERVKRLADVVSGIVDVKKAVDKAQAGCTPTSVFSFGITGQAPLDPSADDAVPSSITGGLKIEF